MTETDVDFAFTFLRDQDVAYARTPPPPNSVDGARSWVSRGLSNPSIVPWILEDSSRNGAGFINLQNYDPVAGVSEVGFLVVASARRKGLATAALRAVTEWTFRNLSIHRLYLVHDLTNEGSCRAALASGYATEGIARSARPGPGGIRLDSEVHAITRSDFESGYSDLSLDESA